MRKLFLDIETSPHKAAAWGLFKQNIAINQILEPGRTLCFAAKWEGQRKLEFAAGQDQQSFETMVMKAWTLLDEADVVIHYNGTKFDIPTLNKEFLMMGLTPPSPYQQIDLLRTMRRQFRLASNKLDYVSQQLGVGSKVNHKGMELWLACMEGDPSAWRVMEKYNKQDVVLLEKVYEEVLPWIHGHPNATLYSENALSCPTCGSTNVQRRGSYYTTAGRWERHHCQSCGKWSRGLSNMASPKKLVGVS